MSRLRLKKNAGLKINAPDFEGVDNDIMEELTIKPQSIDGFVDFHDCDITVTMSNNDVIEYIYTNPTGEQGGVDNSSTTITINGIAVDGYTKDDGISEAIGKAYKNYLKK